MDFNRLAHMQYIITLVITTNCIDDYKVSVIKALRSLFGLGLKDAKKLVDDYVGLDCGTNERKFKVNAAQLAHATYILDHDSPTYQCRSSMFDHAIFSFGDIEKCHEPDYKDITGWS
jgi:hypothetical protein